MTIPRDPTAPVRLAPLRLSPLRSALTRSAPVRLAPVLLVGAGVVGTAIAESHWQSGIEFWIADRDAEAVRRVCRRLNHVVGLSADRSNREPSLDRLESREPPSALNDPEVDALWVGKVGDGGPSLPPPHRPWLVIESVPEDLDLKRRLLGRLQMICPPSTVLATNTSTIPIHRIAATLPQPEFVCGMHFFMPVARRSGAELVVAEATSNQTRSIADAHLRRLGKFVIPAPDKPGFIVNRLLSPYLNEALLMLGENVSPLTLARAAERFGMPMSPLRLIQTIGIPTAFDAGRQYWQSFPHRITPSPILARILKQSRRSEQTIALLDEADERNDHLSVEAAEIVARYRTDHRVGEDDVALRLMAAMKAEAHAMIRDGLRRDLAEFDRAMVGGLAHTGGWSDRLLSIAPESWRRLETEFGGRSASLIGCDGRGAINRRPPPGGRTDRRV